MRYDTLDEALTDIANRSFYDDAVVSPEIDGTYSVEQHVTGYGDTVYWTSEGGMQGLDEALDNSRVHEAYEYYETSGHIRYNLPEAVEELEAGNPVGFTYVIVDHAEPDCNNDWNLCEEHGECQCEQTVGWALVASKE